MQPLVNVKRRGSPSDIQYKGPSFNIPEENRELFVMRLMPHWVRDAGLNQPPVLSEGDLLGSQLVHVLNIQSALGNTEQGVYSMLAL